LMLSVLDSWMRMDRLAVTFSALLGRVVWLFSPSDSEVFDVRESLEAELRSFAVYALRFDRELSVVVLGFSFAKFESPTAVAVEVVLLRFPNKGRRLFMGRSGE
jgi:hypothetical protein